MKIPPPIVREKTPREAWKINGQDLPIRGGWGYCLEDACIVDRNDPVVDPTEEFDSIAVEYEFIENRIMDEIYAGDQGYARTDWELVSQHLIHVGERSYDRLVFKIATYRSEDWNEIEEYWEANHGAESPDFNLLEYLEKRQKKLICYEREFWFDITSFFGRRNSE